MTHHTSAPPDELAAVADAVIRARQALSEAGDRLRSMATRHEIASGLVLAAIEATEAVVRLEADLVEQEAGDVIDLTISRHDATIAASAPR